jgi:hypothetical protein
MPAVAVKGQPSPQTPSFNSHRVIGRSIIRPCLSVAWTRNCYSPRVRHHSHDSCLTSCALISLLPISHRPFARLSTNDFKNKMPNNPAVFSAAIVVISVSVVSSPLRLYDSTLIIKGRRNRSLRIPSSSTIRRRCPSSYSHRSTLSRR